MNVTQEMTLASALGGSGAKLLIHLLFDADGSENDSALMRGSGITDRRTFAAAKAQVKGVLSEQELHACRAVITRTMQELHAGAAVITAPPAPRVTATLAPTVEADVVSRSFFDVLLDADNLPDDGSWSSPYSNVRKRRDAQITALCDAYTDLFPGKELNKASATDLLQAADNRAAPVYSALLKAQERKAEYPVGYAKSVLNAEKSKQASTKPVQIGRQEDGGEDFYMEPSPQYLAKMEKMRRLGLLDDEED